MYKKIVFYILLIFSLNCTAQIYEQTDSNGKVVYSDEPLNENAKPFETAPSTVSTIKQDTVSPSPSKTPEKTHTAYATFKIESPQNEQTFQNPVYVPVQIQLEPRLQDGDKIQIYVDGKPWRAAVVSTKFSLYEIERGSHQIQAKIMNSENISQQESNTVTVYVQRASAIKKPIMNTQ